MIFHRENASVSYTEATEKQGRTALRLHDVLLQRGRA